MKPLRSVAVLGAGTMGSRIAAHFANAGFPVELLDLPGAAAKGLEATAKQKPGAFFTSDVVKLIRTGSFDDNLDRVKECGWIIEAVAENLAIKRQLWGRVAELRTPGTIVSTNTSGIPLAAISEGFPTEFRQHFLGTHFFNPPRYLHLVELIPGAETSREVLDWVAAFCDVHLGKGVVPCKDTPNFIANRIGCFFGSTVHRLTMEGGYTVEEVDAITGPLIGMPKSASFRLVDIVGLDVWAHVLRNLYELAPNDPARDRFVVPGFLQQMLERGWLGEKTGQGFYKRVGPQKEIHAIDLKTLEYHPAAKVKFPSAEMAKNIEPLDQRLRTLVAADDRVGRFLWPLLRDVFLYSAQMVPEISDRIVEIDRAMRWGFAFPMGPFEMWDALGVQEIIARMRREGCEPPASVANVTRFYEDRKRYFDITSGAMRELEPRPGIVVLQDCREVKRNAGASLIDVGDGVLCVEFHSKMNTLGEDAIQMIHAGLAETECNFEAMVVTGEGELFSAGANLMLVLMAAQEAEWDELDRAIRRFQNANMAMKYAAKPVVAAPFGMALGGGCEVVLHATAAQASAETYMGLVEVGVGVIPAAGGSKEMLLRMGDAKKAFELIGFAKVSTSAANARELGYLRERDGVTMNRERLVADAKAAALALVKNHAPGAPRTDIVVEGEAGFALLKMGVLLAHDAGYITDYDKVIGEKLAHVLSGGRLTGKQTVTEQYLLDLEREAFLSLCGQKQTQERMQHMLKTGKPLRN